MNSKAVTSYLAAFERQREFFVEEGHSSATTFGCSGAVLLASALSGTKASDELSQITRLPINFVGAVIFAVEALELWSDESWAYLVRDTLVAKRDFLAIQSSLVRLLKQLWSYQANERIGNLQLVLETSRNGCLVGGGRETWVDPESRISFWVPRRSLVI